MVTLKLIRRVHLTDNVWAFIFDPSQPLGWTAGQFIKVELPHTHPDDEGAKRWFTISSAPHEGVVQITTRLTSSTFKQSLARLPEGGHVNLIDPPAGDFTWRTSRHPLVFVAHGIGITPFYSLLKSRFHLGLSLGATLLYSNRPGTAPVFQSELTGWAQTNPEFTLHQATIPFTTARLAELIPQLSDSLVYVSGPRSLIELLGPPHNLTSRQLKTDFFPGYTSADY